MYAILLRFWPQIAIAACAASIGLWIGHSIGSAGVESEHAERMAERAECVEQQRDVAQRAAEAYSAELEAARARAVAAEEANKSAMARVARKKRTIELQTARLSDASHVPADCITDDVRMRINAAIGAANSARGADR